MDHKKLKFKMLTLSLVTALVASVGCTSAKVKNKMGQDLLNSWNVGVMPYTQEVEPVLIETVQVSLETKKYPTALVAWDSMEDDVVENVNESDYSDGVKLSILNEIERFDTTLERLAK